MKQKTILLISPQPWRDLYISKHHYAIELANNGNKVYFLEPPRSSNSTSIKIEDPGIKNVKVISYKTSFPLSIRFHARKIYNFLMKLQAKKIAKQIEEPIDIVWCFEPNLFSNLKWFRGETNIYHPVDFLTQKYQIEVAKTANYIFSVSQNILDLFNDYTIPKSLINHGLANYFVKNQISNWNKREKLRFAYIGNLLIAGMDRKSMMQIISDNSIEFEFYGLYEDERYGNEEAINFIDYLKDQKNVTLHGLVHPNELSKALNKYDGFLVCYNSLVELNSGSNCHKVLEYLSYGRIVISSRLSEYNNHRDLLAMSNREDNSDYIELFNNCVNNIDQLNTVELQEKRREFALANSYQKQIGRISDIINKQ